jgi:D-aminoacyl-tRNA deacylase
MRVVIQRVSEAAVKVNNTIVGEIAEGFMVLVGFEADDNMEDITWITQKIVQLRVFADAQDAMNLSIMDVQGDILLISQFTLHAASKKGNRPSFIKAAKPIQATELYNQTIEKLTVLLGKPIQTGIFGADMQVSLCNNGPVTIILDSKNKDLF